MNEVPCALTDEERAEIETVIAGLTLQQKASLTAGRNMWQTVALPQAGIPSWRMSDGPNGVRGSRFGPAGLRALCFPSGSALGATWNTELVREIGVALGEEARDREARILLAPTVNIQRSPLAGRNFECFSEDPRLAGKLAAAYVTGVQSQGVVTTVKHFAGNEAEFERSSIDSIVDERTLREIYLAPFEAAVREGGALGIMTAYNRLNGMFCADHPWLLQTVLRDEWGFEGLVVSDWWALADTLDATRAGLDIEMPGPARAMGAKLAEAVARGDIDESLVDERARRLLTVMTRMRARHDVSDQPERGPEDARRTALARRAAGEAMVLIRNERNILPIDPGRVRKIAVIGPNADRPQIMGGGSATLRAHHRTSPLAALRAALKDQPVEIVFSPGCGAGEKFAILEPTDLTTPAGEPGIEVAFFAGPAPEGEPVCIHRGDTSEFIFMGEPAPGVPAGSFSIRATATFKARWGGVHRFRLSTGASARLVLQGEERARIDTSGDAGGYGGRSRVVDIDLAAGSDLHLVVEMSGASAGSFTHTSLSCAVPIPPDAIRLAAAAAADADLAIVVVGTSSSVETEGVDRSSLSLPGAQDELVSAICAANPDTIVVVNAGSPVTMPWLSQAAATLQCWFAGQEMSAALADVLLGAADPGGRMPITFPTRIEHTPGFGNFPGEAGEVRYSEGLLVGYRWYEARHIPVAIPFGHGLSYTRFQWKATLPASRVAPLDGAVVVVDVTNVGDRAGSDVVQVYVRPPKGPLSRPVRELQGFAKVHLAPGETRRIEIRLDPRCFAYWHPGDAAGDRIRARLATTPFASRGRRDTRRRGWAIEAGEYVLEIARSSADLVTTLPLTIETGVDGWHG